MTETKFLRNLARTTYTLHDSEDYYEEYPVSDYDELLDRNHRETKFIALYQGTQNTFHGIAFHARDYIDEIFCSRAERLEIYEVNGRLRGVETFLGGRKFLTYWVIKKPKNESLVIWLLESGQLKKAMKFLRPLDAREVTWR